MTREEYERWVDELYRLPYMERGVGLMTVRRVLFFLLDELAREQGLPYYPGPRRVHEGQWQVGQQLHGPERDKENEDDA